MTCTCNIFKNALRCFAALGIIFLSACDKEDSGTAVNKEQQIEKKVLEKTAKSLRFYIPRGSGNTYTAPTSYTFSSPDGGYTFSQTSSGYTYSVSSEGFSYTANLSLSTMGSGSATIDGKSVDFDFVICGDLFVDYMSDDENDVALTIYVGISGDFESPEHIHATQILEFIAYQENIDGKVNLGAFDDYNAMEDGEFGFIFYIDASDAESIDAFGADPFATDGGIKAYLSNGGSADLSAGLIQFNNVPMVKVIDGDAGAEVKASGSLVCN